MYSSNIMSRHQDIIQSGDDVIQGTVGHVGSRTTGARIWVRDRLSSTPVPSQST
jgi:hypothetical protein